MRTAASESAGARPWTGMLVAVLVALVTIPSIQASVSAHDHLLLGLRGVNRCKKYRSSNRALWPSIQP